MSLRKDKEKVLGEIFDVERIKTFLTGDAPQGVDVSFSLLERAYRGMRGENFGTFVELFVAAGHDINAKNADGQTFLSIVKTHRNSEEYVDALAKAGAV